MTVSAHFLCPKLLKWQLKQILIDQIDFKGQFQLVKLTKWLKNDNLQPVSMFNSSQWQCSANFIDQNGLKWPKSVHSSMSFTVQVSNAIQNELKVFYQKEKWNFEWKKAIP